jgi:hypothetical protein
MSKDKIILIYDWAMKADEYAACLNAIGKMKDVRAITISHFWLESGLSVNNKKNHKNERLLTFWSKFQESISFYKGEYPEIFANRHLIFQFERIKEEMENASDFGDFFSLLLDLLKPSLIIFAHEAFTIERTLVGLARNAGISTASLFHGSLGPKVGVRGISGDVDYIFVWNDIDINWVSSFDVNLNRLRKIGCVRYEKQYNDYLNSRSSYDLLEKKDAKEFIRLDGSKPLITLLTAAVNTGFAAHVAYPRKHRDALRSIMSLAKSRPDLQFLIKAHPSYDYPNLYKDIHNFGIINLVFDEQLKLHEVLQATDICVLVNYCTTAALEAMLQHIPVVFFDNAIYPMSDWQDSFSYTNTVRIDTVGKLENAINDLLTCNGLIKKALMEAKKTLQIFLGVEADTASQRLYISIQQILNNSKANKGYSLNCNRELYDFLYSNDAKNLQHRDGLIRLYELSALMYVFSYLSGVFNLRASSLQKIIDLFKLDDRKFSQANYFYWHLLQAHIEGRNNNASDRRSLFNALCLLLIIVRNLNRFVSAPKYLKKSIAKYLINQIFGFKMMVLIKDFYRILNR